MTTCTSDACENERAVVGTLLMNPNYAGDISRRVSSHEFIDQQLGKVFAVIVHSVSNGKQGKAVLQDVLHSKLIPVREIGDLISGVRDPGFAIWHADEIRHHANKQQEDPKGHTRRASTLFAEYLDKLRRGDTDKLYKLPDPFLDFEVGPGLISVWGAGPGTGKTAAASQLLFGALELNPHLLVTIANAEMGFDTLARRELLRRTGIPDKRIRFADLSTSDWMLIDKASSELQPLLTRVRWLEAPYTFDQLKKLHSDAPGLLVVDYLQKFAPDSESVRTGVSAVMAQLRHLALSGWGVLALSATARTYGKRGSGHDGKALSLASFRESSEIEFNADSAYLLRSDGDVGGKSWLRSVTFCCVKNRNGELLERATEFNAAGMRFSLLAGSEIQMQESGPFEFYPDDDDELEGFDDGR